MSGNKKCCNSKPKSDTWYGPGQVEINNPVKKTLAEELKHQARYVRDVDRERANELSIPLYAHLIDKLREKAYEGLYEYKYRYFDDAFDNDIEASDYRDAITKLANNDGFTVARSEDRMHCLIIRWK